MSAISRLKATFEGLLPATTKTFQMLGDLMAPMSSWRTLREAIEECVGSKTLPFLGLYLNDLTFTEEGNPDFIEDDYLGTLINIPKHQMIFKCVDSFLRYQKHMETNVSMKEIPILSLIKQLPKLSGEDLYQLSLEREPRGVLAKDLE
eukprot:TRINITY_DN6992_c0_g1_i1.p1 TRINITY_DN6992_c0_g1~~TRINITY_DN6992_c0_g1_i1.p1  ORF type:complete len:148 (+),score=37.15 TRINITY_DN6992_c0_g1_i1:460-903(+)